MLKKREKQLITLCIAFAMLFSGMYFEKLKVDSQFVACNFPDNPAVIRAAEPTAVVAYYQKLSQESRSVANTIDTSTERKNRLESVELLLFYWWQDSFPCVYGWHFYEYTSVIVMLHIAASLLFPIYIIEMARNVLLRAKVLL